LDTDNVRTLRYNLGAESFAATFWLFGTAKFPAET
jgi:hypothetical protein